MNLKQLLQALDTLDNGTDMKSFIQTHLTEKDSAITAAEQKALNLGKQLENVSKALGVGTDEVLNKVKELGTATGDSEKLNKDLEKLKADKVELEGKVKELSRRDQVKDFSAVAKTNAAVLLDLIPAELELKLKDDKAFVVVGEADVAFEDYIKNDPKLKLYAPAIFVDQEPEKPEGKKVNGQLVREVKREDVGQLPGGKGPKTNKAERAVDRIVRPQPGLDRLKQRLNIK